MFSGDNVQAITANHFTGVDCLGNAADDYASIISYQLHRLDTPKVADKPAFQSTVIYRLIQQFKRRIKRKKPILLNTPLCYEIEPSYFAREQLVLLRTQLSSNQFSLLFVYGVCENKLEAWRFFGCPGSKSNFYLRLEKAQARAKEVLNNG